MTRRPKGIRGTTGGSRSPRALRSSRASSSERACSRTRPTLSTRRASFETRCTPRREIEMSVRIHQCRVLDATPDMVWRNIEDISTHVEWMKDAIEIRFLTEEQSGVGARFWCLTKVGPFSNRDVLVVTEWKPAEVMG